MRYIQKHLNSTSQALLHILVAALLLIMPMIVYLKMDDATAKSMEIQVFLTSFAGLAYLSFGIKTWVISKFAEELGLNVDTYERRKSVRQLIQTLQDDIDENLKNHDSGDDEEVTSKLCDNLREKNAEVMTYKISAI